MLKFFFLYFIIRLFIELHKVWIYWQILKTNNHLGLPTEMELLLFIAQINTRHVIELVYIVRIPIVGVVLNSTVEARNVKALIVNWVYLLVVLSNLTLPSEGTHLKVSALSFTVILTRLILMVRRSLRIFLLRQWSLSILKSIGKNAFGFLIFIIFEYIFQHSVYDLRCALVRGFSRPCNNAKLRLQIFIHDMARRVPIMDSNKCTINIKKTFLI